MSKMEKVHAKVRTALPQLPEFASILLVEEQSFDRMRLRRLIATLEFDTHIVEADCLEAMGTMLEQDTFDLILLDFNMPDGNGLQALDAVRLSPKNRNAATIMVAREDQSDVALEALKRGCSDYITEYELTEDVFKRATINALQKSHLSQGIESQNNRRRQMETVLTRFSTECASEIKPVVSQMIRQLRDLRDAGTLSADDHAQRHDTIERSCVRLLEFLTDLEGYEGRDLSKMDHTAEVIWKGSVSAAESVCHVSPVRSKPHRVVRRPDR